MSADAQKTESRRRRLTTRPYASYASPYATVQSSATAAGTSPTKASAGRPHRSTQQQQSSSVVRGESASATLRPSPTIAVAASKESGREASISAPHSTRSKFATTSATHARNSVTDSSRTTTMGSRVPALAMADLTAASTRASTTTGRDSAGSSHFSKAAKRATTPATPAEATAAIPKQTTVRVGALIINRGGTSDRLGHTTRENLTPTLLPYTASPIGSPHLFQTTPFGPNVLTVYDPCDLFELHHALQHRLIEELGWSLHWYLDTETEIQHLELKKEMEGKARAHKSSTGEQEGSAADVQATVVNDTTDEKDVATTAASEESSAAERGSASLKAAQARTDNQAAATSRHSDPSTPQSHRVDAQGRQLPYIRQKSQFGVMSARFECSLCHELAAVRRSAFAFSPRSRLNRSPYEFRLASLRRWLRKRSTESAADALLASCLSVEVERYLAYLGLADCWTSLFVTAGLPVLHPVSSPETPPTAACEKALCLPSSLSLPARFERVPLSFYVLPALCRWKALKPAHVEKLLRTAAVHPFSLSLCFTSMRKEAAAARFSGSVSAASSAASSLTFFVIQQQSHLPDKRRSSSRRNQMASLGESCVCDVYLVAASTTDDSEAATSVWGYVQRDAQKGNGNSKQGDKGAGETLPASTGELFYIASSLENYLRLGIVFGWVYGWQMCFSTAGPPSNSVPWLQWINASAYKAALASNSDTAP